MILVTGANGFVGRALIERLRAGGHVVRAAVRDDVAGAAMRAAFPSLDVVTVGQIGAMTRWEIALMGVEAVVHLASRVHVMHETEPNPLRAFREVNTEGTNCLAHAAVLAGVSHFVYLSTVKVNGERTTDQPFSDADAAQPVDFYAISKWEAEQTLSRIAAESGMRVTLLRPPLVYGPGVKGNFLRLLGWARAAYPLPLAAIHNRRSLLFLGNLVDAIMMVLASPLQSERAYLLCDGGAISTPDLIRKLAGFMHVRPRLWPFPVCGLKLAGKMLGQREAVRRLSDSLMIDDARFRQELGWTPPYTLEQGLEQTVNWYLRWSLHD